MTQAVSPTCPSKRRTIAITMTRTKPMCRELIITEPRKTLANKIKL